MRFSRYEEINHLTSKSILIEILRPLKSSIFEPMLQPMILFSLTKMDTYVANYTQDIDYHIKSRESIFTACLPVLTQFHVTRQLFRDSGLPISSIRTHFCTHGHELFAPG